MPYLQTDEDCCSRERNLQRVVDKSKEIRVGSTPQVAPLEIPRSMYCSIHRKTASATSSGPAPTLSKARVRNGTIQALNNRLPAPQTPPCQKLLVFVPFTIKASMLLQSGRVKLSVLVRYRGGVLPPCKAALRGVAGSLEFDERTPPAGSSSHHLY